MVLSLSSSINLGVLQLSAVFVSWDGQGSKSENGISETEFAISK